MKTIAGQMERMGEKDPELASWLLAFEEGMGEWVIVLPPLFLGERHSQQLAEPDGFLL